MLVTHRPAGRLALATTALSFVGRNAGATDVKEEAAVLSVRAATYVVNGGDESKRRSPFSMNFARRRNKVGDRCGEEMQANSLPR